MSLHRKVSKFWARLRHERTLSVLYQGLTFAPRLIVHLASLAILAGLAVACVPATQYEEAKSASEVELAGRQRAEAELFATRAKLDAANAELGQRDQKLAATEQSVSESKLESSVALKERDEATGLVDQLRGELGRVGDNLRDFAQQKAELERSLAAAQAHKQDLERSEAQTVAIARLTRDLAVALGDRVLSGDLTIDAAEGRVVVSAPNELWFNDNASLASGTDRMLAAIARVLTVHTGSSVEVAVTGGVAESDPRAQVLGTALGAHGIDAARIKRATPPPPPGANAAKPVLFIGVELAFSAG